MTERLEGLDELLDYVVSHIPDPVTQKEEPEAQVTGRCLGLTDEEIGWLHMAHLACDRLNASLANRNSMHRWQTLGSSDPRRVRKGRP
jgi:hypothetical protein